MSTKHFLLMQSHSLTQKKKFMKQFILSIVESELRDDEILKIEKLDVENVISC